MKKMIFFISFSLFLLNSCKHDNPKFQEELKANGNIMHNAIRKLTDVITYNIFPPNTASRIYAYATIAAYEAMAQGEPTYNSLSGQLNGLAQTPKPEMGKEYCFPIAGVKAFLVVGKKLTFSDEDMDIYTKKVIDEYNKMGVPKEILERSIAYGDAVAAHILAWADKDNYKQTRTFPKYQIQKDPATWQPTPPPYMDAAEPHWNKIRPWTLDSAAQFMPPRPTKYSKDKNSQFYKEAYLVYETVKKQDPKLMATAQFWDDNGFAVQVAGHVMSSIKKITPGGHWMNIAMYTGRQSKLNMMQSSELYAKTAIALADGFISCWDEKYRSNLVRPETYITQAIDKEWVPYLQTPPFPEYTSGHSVISNAACTVMTNLLGKDVTFTDSTEVQFGIEARTFHSFYEAADEACISRLYGGIHYMPAIENGKQQGRKLGEWVVKKIKTKK